MAETTTAGKVKAHRVPVTTKDGNRSAKAIGNSSPFFQPKLTVGPTDDVYEKEADAVAEKVMRTSAPAEQSFFAPPPIVTTPLVSRKCASCDEEDKVQKKEDDQEAGKPDAAEKAGDLPAGSGSETDGAAVKSKSFSRPPFFNPPAPIAPVLQRTCSACEEEEKLQRKEDKQEAEEATFRKTFAGSTEPVPEEDRLQRKLTPFVQRQEASAPATIPSPDPTGPAAVNWFEMLRPFYNRGAEHLLLDPNSYNNILQPWVYNYNFFQNIGLGDNFATGASNFFTPLAIDSALKGDYATWWERTDREMGTSSFILSPTIFNFDLHNLPDSFTMPAPFRNIFGLPENPYLQRKCKSCEAEEKEELQRKEATNDGAPSEAPAMVQEVLNAGGSPLDFEAKAFMESRFGFDFSHVKIHTDSTAVRSAQAINALAYTSGNNIVFNKGQYAPASTTGKKLLAHELTHVLQQQPAAAVQRQVQRVPEPKISEEESTEINFNSTKGSISEDIAFIKQALPLIKKTLILQGNILMIYKIDGSKPIQLKYLKIKNEIVLWPYYHLWAPDRLFYPISYEGVSGEIKYGIKKTATTEQQKKVIQELDNNYSPELWFTSDADLKSFHESFSDEDIAKGIGLIVMPYAGATKSGGGGAAGGGPPKPDWAKAFEKDLKELIKNKKVQEPTSEDIPDIFNFKYSEKSARWRGVAAQNDTAGNPDIKIYIDIPEGSKVADVFDIIRQKIRIKKLEGVRDTTPGKDSKALKESFLWAYELKLKLEKLIQAEAKEHSNLWNLPDKLSLTSRDDDDTNIYLQVHVYSKFTTALGAEQTQMKAGTLPDPLQKDMSPEQLILIVKQATRILKGEEVKWRSEKKADYKHLKEAYPAKIVPKNVRPDGRTVTKAEHEFVLDMDLTSLEGDNLLHLTTLNMRTVYYYWDIYRVDDQLSEDERKKLVPDWKERRTQLVNHFKQSGQLKTTPLINEEKLKSYNLWMQQHGLEAQEITEKTPRQELESFKSAGIVYGQRVNITPEAEFELPDREGDYLIYCRAQVKPIEDVYWMPSEAFFPIRVVDGYKLAEETTNKPETVINDLKSQLAEAKTEKDKEDLEKRIEKLEKHKSRTLIDRTLADIAETDEAVRLAQKLKDIYLTTQDSATPFALILIEDHDDGEKLLDLWTMLEMQDSDRPLDARIDDLVKNLGVQKKGLGDLQSRINAFKSDIDYKNSVTPSVTLVSKETGQEYQLITMLAEAPEKAKQIQGSMPAGELTAVILVDVTTYKTQEKYYGYSSNPDKKEALKEATQHAFQEFGENCAYGKGYLAYKVPVLNVAGRVNSKPGVKQQIISVLQGVAAVAGIAALVLGTVATGGALGVAAVALGVGSAVIGGVVAASNIYNRYENYRLEADVELALDIMNIVGPMLTTLNTAAKIGKASAIGSGALKTAEGISKVNSLIKLEKGFAFVQKLELATNFYLLNHKMVKDLDEIQNSDLPPDKKDAVMRQVVLNGLLANVMIAVAVRNELKAKISPSEAELNKLISNAADEAKYLKRLQKAGLVDAEGKWTIKELDESAAKSAAEGAVPAKPGADPTTTPKVTPEEPYIKPTGKTEADAYEKAREVDMTGHTKSPDKQHEVEAYPDGTFGRCSPAGAGDKCPLLRIVFKSVLDERPELRKQLDELMARIVSKGEKVPKQMLDELAVMEQRMRNIETVKATSSAPADYKIKEIGYKDDIDLPLMESKTLLEYPNGERVWRGKDYQIHHEGPIGSSIGRQGREKEKLSGGKTGLSGMKDYERAHSIGQGFGWESPFAILYAPRYVNQKLQNNGIEQYIRTLRDLLPPGQKLVVHTATKAIPDTLRLQSMTYEGFVVTATGEKVKAFSFEIKVSGTREKPVTDAGPIKFATSSNPIHQQAINNLKTLIPAANLPEPIKTATHHEGF